nr:hypothetical protein PB20LOC_01536 [Pectobacterium parmentieri]
MRDKSWRDEGVAHHHEWDVSFQIIRRFPAKEFDGLLTCGIAYVHKFTGFIRPRHPLYLPRTDIVPAATSAVSNILHAPALNLQVCLVRQFLPV